MVPVDPVLICEFAVIFNSGKRTRCRDFKEPQVLPEPMETLDRRARKELRDFEVHRALREPKVLRELKVVQAQMEPRAPKGLRAPKVRRDFKVRRVTRALRDLQ